MPHPCGGARLLGGSTAFFAKKAVGKKAQRGDTPLWTPPRRTPAYLPLRRDCAGTAEQKPSRLPMNSLLYCRQNQVAEGRPLGGEWRGEREVPLSTFSFPHFFLQKEMGLPPSRRPARRAHILPVCREHQKKDRRQFVCGLFFLFRPGGSLFRRSRWSWR